MKNTLDITLMEELSNLEYFVVKAPVNTADFWREWQEKYSRAFMSKTAIKKILKTKKLNYEELKRYKALLKTYEDTVLYLENIKRLALSLRGVFDPEGTNDFNDESTDFDP
ncbi:MAG: hypothetical protein D6674_03500 [Acidobacteria bacterium]|jgi:uncharacterized protein (UPF0335 family)|nr:MAG: hypothetical protein D6674_03500 [Acidobacteriota bacterium]